MKKLNRNFYRKEIAVFIICVSLFATPFVLAKCTKGSEAERPKDAALREFTASPVYKDFIGKKHVIGKVDADAARIVRVDNTAALVHIPVMRHSNVDAAIIGIPLGRKGQYELLYQDNRAALSGTGNIYLYTSANELFARIYLQNGKINSIEPAKEPGITQRVNAQARIDCDYWCRVKRCYATVKQIFPGELACDLLDMFMGVCTAASAATCMIKAAQ
jgi:hypothetical protein